MNIAIAYYLLVIYLVVICKPTLPVLTDVAAHVFWRTDHLAKVHHHNGNKHVDHEIQSIEKQDGNGNTDVTVKSPEPIAIHLTMITNYDFSRQPIAIASYRTDHYDLQSPFLEISCPPPKA